MANEIEKQVDMIRNKLRKLEIYQQKVESWADEIMPAISHLMEDQLSETARKELLKIRECLTDSIIFSKNYTYAYKDTFFYNKHVVNDLYCKVVKHEELVKRLERPLRHILSNISKFESLKKEIYFDGEFYNSRLKSKINEFDDLIINLQLSSKIAFMKLYECLDKILSIAVYVD